MWLHLLDEEAKAKKRTSCITAAQLQDARPQTQAQELWLPLGTGSHASQMGPALATYPRIAFNFWSSHL